MPTLPESVVLLAQPGADGIPKLYGFRLDYAVAGATLAETVLAGGEGEVDPLVSHRATEKIIVHLGQLGYLREGIRKVMGMPLRQRFDNADLSWEDQARAAVTVPKDMRDRILAALMDPELESPHWTVTQTREALQRRVKRQKIIDATR